MPPEYEYLNAPLLRAQEHMFLINAEMEKLDGNPINEYRLVRLQDERQAIIGNIKQEFEMQTWEEGPARFEQIEKVIDYQFSDERYRIAKPALLESGKEYSASQYWHDKLDRNMEYYKNLDKEIKQVDREERFKTARIVTYQDWEYEMHDRDISSPNMDDLDFDLER